MHDVFSVLCCTLAIALRGDPITTVGRENCRAPGRLTLGLKSPEFAHKSGIGTGTFDYVAVALPIALSVLQNSS